VMGEFMDDGDVQKVLDFLVLRYDMLR
jgi:hypothetical protein